MRQGPTRPVVESVLRALRLLECFEQGEPELPLATFVRRSGYSKTTAHRLLNTLEAAGWLERTREGAFRFTMRAYRTGSILVDSLDLRAIALPIMRQLSISSQQTIYLMVPIGTHAVCLERVSQGIRVQVLELEVGGSLPLNVGGAPRALLAFREELLPALLQAGLESRTPLTLKTEATLRADLVAVRRRGYAVSDEDSTLGVAALAAPIRDSHNQVVAALSLGGLRDDILSARTEHLKSLLQATADISAQLGARGVDRATVDAERGLRVPNLEQEIVSTSQ